MKGLEGAKPLSKTSSLYFWGGVDTPRRVKRGEASLINQFPLPLIKGKGDKGGWGR